MAARTKTPVDAVYVNCEVVTVDERRPTAQAVAVGGGRILAVGGLEEVMSVAGASARVVDLGGRALVPGFIDAHSRFTQVAAELDWVDLQSPPVGVTSSIDDMVRLLRLRRGQLETAHKYILGTGYDESMLDEGRHPTKQDLDRVSTDHPVWVVHASRHMAVGNSLALAQAGIEAATPDPEGGVIARIPGTREPSGLLQEAAWAHVALTFLPPVAEHRLPDLVRRTGDYYARLGITTAQDGAADVGSLRMLRAAAEAGTLPIDVIGYTLSILGDQVRAESERYRRGYVNRFRLGGQRITLDGSMQGKTAWLSRPYLIPPIGEPASYAGFPFYPDRRVVDELFESAFRAGRQVIAHASGDAAAELMIEAVARAREKLGPADRRPVMIHAQTVREDQLDRMQALGIIPSFFPAQCFFWGDWSVASVLGEERALRMSPARSAAQRGMRFSLHTGAPVMPPNVVFLMYTAVTRLSRGGAVIGADQRLTAQEALRAVTLDAAYQHFEEATKGSIEVGKLADLVVLSENPLRVHPEAIKDIEVVATLKEGVPIFVADPSRLPAAFDRPGVSI